MFTTIVIVCYKTMNYTIYKQHNNVNSNSTIELNYTLSIINIVKINVKSNVEKCNPFLLLSSNELQVTTLMETSQVITSKMFYSSITLIAECFDKKLSLSFFKDFQE